MCALCTVYYVYTMCTRKTADCRGSVRGIRYLCKNM